MSKNTAFALVVREKAVSQNEDSNRVTVPLHKHCRGDAQGLQERVITGFDLVRAEVAAPGSDA